MMRKGFLLAGLMVPGALALAGCLEDAGPRPAASRTEGASTAPVRAAAEERVRGVSRNAETLRFRAVETYRQAMPNTYAVCGQATVSGDAVYIPFVSVVSTTGGKTEVEQYVARTNIEATRVYVELVSRCFEGGGPIQRPGGALVSQPTPPLPNGLPVLDQVAPEPPRAEELLTAASSPAASAAGGTVVMRQNGNLRASPGGGGAVLRVARSGSVLNVFGTAPGGWFQVGETGPEGWVHGSVAGRQGTGAMASVQ